VRVRERTLFMVAVRRLTVAGRRRRTATGDAVRERVGEQVSESERSAWSPFSANLFPVMEGHSLTRSITSPTRQAAQGAEGMVRRAAHRTAAELLSSCADREEERGEEEEEEEAEEAARGEALRSWLVSNAVAAAVDGAASDAAGLADDDFTAFGRETLECY
jgi:hypothetical protein